MSEAVLTPSTRTTPSASIPLPLLVGTFVLLWSSAFAVGKVALADCPPLLFLAARFLAAGVLMMGLAAATGARWTLSKRDVLVFAALGVVSQAMFLGIGFIALKTVSSGLAALIISSNPIIAAIFAVFLLGERVTWRKVLGLLLGLGGVAFIVRGRLVLGTDQLGGVALAVLALLAFVGGTILFKLFAPNHGHWIGNGIQSLTSGLALAPFAAGFESFNDVVPTWSLVAAFAYSVLFVSIFAYLLWFRILTVSGTTAASSYHFLIPPLGILFGWLLLGEHVDLTDMLGIIPVALGIFLVTRPSSKVRS
ncbi:MAG TPA: DMT family transporter [Pseudolabrys sp.]|jgi:drug/metabolite transporter (DMT)-like permease|nr:DMT family transporter [Pseudolabrys sp.]